MNCDQCRLALQAHLDGDPVSGDDLDAHLHSCADCRALHAAAIRLRVGLLAAAAPTPPAGLSDRIVAGVLKDQRARRRMRRRIVFAVVGLAAAASLVIAVFFRGGTSGGSLAQVHQSLHDFLFPRPPVRVVAFDPSHSMPDGDKEPPAPPSLNDNMEQATSAVASLARRTADQTVNDGQLLVPSVTLPMPKEEGVTPTLEPPAESLREAGHGVASGLEPVAHHARRAFNLFLRDMPPVTPDTKPGL
jgi:hypothetical protein